MTLRRFLPTGLALFAMALLTGCYYPAPPPAAYAPPACGAPVVNPDGTTSAPANCYYAPYAYYPYYYPYPAYYYPPYYYGYGGPAVAVGVGFGFRGRFR